MVLGKEGEMISQMFVVFMSVSLVLNLSKLFVFENRNTTLLCWNIDLNVYDIYSWLFRFQSYSIYIY